MEKNNLRTYNLKQENEKDAVITFSQENTGDNLIDVVEFLIQRIIKLEEEVKKLNNK